MLDIRARVESDATIDAGRNVRITLTTNGREHPLTTDAKPDGRGLAANGGEMLCLALATCYCNDAYREANARGVALERVGVEVRSTFGAAGEPASALSYRVRLSGSASEADLRALAEHTDRVAEVHNTIRRGMAVTLEEIEVESSARVATSSRLG